MGVQTVAATVAVGLASVEDRPLVPIRTRPTLLLDCRHVARVDGDRRIALVNTRAAVADRLRVDADGVDAKRG